MRSPHRWPLSLAVPKERVRPSPPSARPAPSGGWWGRRQGERATPTASPSPAASGGPTVPRRPSAHATGASTCKAARTTHAIRLQWVVPWPSARTVATPLRPRAHRGQARGAGVPLTLARCVSAAPSRCAALPPSFATLHRQRSPTDRPTPPCARNRRLSRAGDEACRTRRGHSPSPKAPPRRWHSPRAFPRCR
jgi:hypothetical protein